MDLYRIIRELAHERDRVQKIIESLELMSHEPQATGPVVKRRRGRKSMDASARKEVSERMLRYWADRRAKKDKKSGD